MLRLKSDLLPALVATADGVLEHFDLRWHDDAALTVVMAAKGYPGDYAKGTRDPRPRRAPAPWRASRSSTPARAATATACSPPAAACSTSRRAARRSRGAAARLSRPCAKIDWPGGFCRTDIGWRAIAREEGKVMSAIARPVPRLRRAAHQDTQGAEIFLRTGGSGPPLLLLHGYPQTHVCWHKIAPELARHVTLVIADLRGYGASSAPPGDAEHTTYSKRAMAEDCLRVMRALGHERFMVAGHDRGGRVAYRLALDHPEAVRRSFPSTSCRPPSVWRRMTAERALKSYHWAFLAQPEPHARDADRARTRSTISSTR